jgi:hypothetical protein
VFIIDVGCLADPAPLMIANSTDHLVTTVILDGRCLALRTELELTLSLQIPNQLSILGVLVLSLDFDTRLSVVIRTD